MNNRDTSPSLFFKERGTEGVSSSRVALGDRGGEFFGGSARVRDARNWTMTNRGASPSLFFKERGTEGVSSSRVALGDRGGEFFQGRTWGPRG